MNVTGHQIWVDRFPDDLRRRIKSAAAWRGITLREAMIEAARIWCDLEEAGSRTGQGLAGDVARRAVREIERKAAGEDPAPEIADL